MKSKKYVHHFSLLALVAASVAGLGMYPGRLGDDATDKMVLIEREAPVKNDGTEPELTAFWLDKNLVTVAEFDAFVKATGYITEADRYGDAGVFDANLQAFVSVKGANYQYPFGKDKPAAPSDHPVTQVSWHDAVAYATWKGKRLPTRQEWEDGARSGSQNPAHYSWGNGLVENGKFKANTWQGNFPFHNTAEDGYAYTSPVGAFGTNSIGLTDMGGNVWQWCSDVVEPQPHEKMVDPASRRLLKGGSYLCDPTVCHGYKITGLSSSTPESSMAHIGFRCAKDEKRK